MHRATALLLSLPLALAAACGGASPADFAGIYEGGASANFKDPDGYTATQQYPQWREVLAPSADGEHLLLDGPCPWMADVKDAETFEFLPSAKCEVGSGGGGCRISEQVSGGTGKLVEDGLTLELTRVGTLTQFECTDSWNNAVFGYHLTARLRRK